MARALRSATATAGTVPRAGWAGHRAGTLTRDGLQFLAFCAVGAAGTLVNLAAYAGQVTVADVAPPVAAVTAFWLAVAHNYLANRWLTFRRHRRGFAAQGARFVVVALLALAVNLAVLALLLPLVDAVAAQAIAICVATPVNFVGNTRWSFAGGGR
jgi:putative flippase GtrA